MSMKNPVAEKTVKETLELDIINIIDFKIGSTTVTPDMYDRVKVSIQNFEIYVLVDPVFLTAKKSAAVYQYQHQLHEYQNPLSLKLKTYQFFDCIILKHAVLDTNRNLRLKQQQTIVHECTHAGFDLLAVSRQTKLENEAAAYIAGALFAVAVLSSHNVNPNAVNLTQSIFAEAWVIAQKLYSEGTGATVTTDDYKAIKKALFNDPLYINRKLNSISPNNGVDAANKSFIVPDVSPLL